MLSGPSGNIFVTGATGFLGSHFVREWLRAARGHVFAMVRERNSQTGASRLAAALALAHQASGTPDAEHSCSLTAIDGDLGRTLMGIEADDVARLQAANVEVFWHFAADLRYDDRDYEAARRVNVEGALHALEAAAAIGVKRFVYVSTAYVCGRQTGVIEEALVPLDRTFSNGYEASKAEAEQSLAAACERMDLPLTILRPSIVVGPRATQSAYGSDTGLFSLIRAAMWVRSSPSAQTVELRIPACPEAEVNFIPVDCVVSDMLALDHAKDGKRQIYHLTSQSSVSVAQCWSVISHLVDLHNIVLVQADAFEPSTVERLIARRIGFFLSYINLDRRFVRTLSPAWVVDAEDFAGYVRKGIERVAHGA